MSNQPKPSDSTAPRKNHILAICCMSLLLVGMDVTIVNVALPSIQKDLRAPLADLQWVVDAYTLVVASLLMLAGSMSDRYGRKRAFMTGLVIFTTGSALCSLSPSVHALIGFRGLQGLGACMLNPVALSIIAEAFRDPKERARAVGIWGAVFGLSLALGPVIGGLLTQTIGWRSIFWVNVPIGIVAVILTSRYIPESKSDKPRAFDPAGQIFIVFLFSSLTFALIEGPRIGWTSPFAYSLFGLSAASLIGVLVVESRRKQPMIDLRFFQSVPFTGATIIAPLAFACFAGFLFVNALYLQQVRHFSAFETGLHTLPLAATGMICGPLSGRIVANYGTRIPLMAAGSCLAFGSLMLTSLTDQTSIPFLLVAYTIFGIGIGTVNPPIATVAVSGMPRSQTSVAAAVASTSRQVGAALGVALVGTVVRQGQSAGLGFSRAAHPIWWGMVACGLAVALLGYLTNTAWAKASTARIAQLFS